MVIVPAGSCEGCAFKYCLKISLNMFTVSAKLSEIDISKKPQLRE